MPLAILFTACSPPTSRSSTPCSPGWGRGSGGGGVAGACSCCPRSGWRSSGCGPTSSAAFRGTSPATPGSTCRARCRSPPGSASTASRSSSSSPARRRRRSFAAALGAGGRGALVPLLLLPLAGRWSLGRRRRTRRRRRLGRPVRLLQPNIPNLVEFEPVAVARNYRKIIDLSLDACEPGALVVWPESAAGRSSTGAIRS